MQIEIITEKLELNLLGFSGTAADKDYAGTAFKLSGRMWQAVKENNIKNKGKNIWVYDSHHGVFAGVEAEDIVLVPNILELRHIILEKYAYYKYIGPYNMIGHAGQLTNTELKNRGLETCLPYIEIYGHWTNDKSKSETELLVCLK